MNSYNLHLNSYGDLRGKGIAVYYKEDKFSISISVKLSNLQISMLSSNDLDVIFLYRSSSCMNIKDHVLPLINPSKSIIICGDFNFCFKEKSIHPLTEFLLEQGFEQKVEEATYFAGSCLDQVYYLRGKCIEDIKVQLYSPYYTALDHDAVCITISSRENWKMENSFTL